MRVQPFCGLVLIFCTAPVLGKEVPTSLVCSSNAKAWRDYRFSEKRWEGSTTLGIRTPFGTTTSAKKNPAFALRDKIFSGLDTEKPIVRSITPAEGDVPEQAAEFEPKILLRTPTELFITWSNDINKVWLAVVDLRNRKAVVTQTFRGLTSVGGEMESLDCR